MILLHKFSFYVNGNKCYEINKKTESFFEYFFLNMTWRWAYSNVLNIKETLYRNFFRTNLQWLFFAPHLSIWEFNFQSLFYSAWNRFQEEEEKKLLMDDSYWWSLGPRNWKSRTPFRVFSPSRVNKTSYLYVKKGLENGRKDSWD